MKTAPDIQERLLAFRASNLEYRRLGHDRDVTLTQMPERAVMKAKRLPQKISGSQGTALLLGHDREEASWHYQP